MKRIISLITAIAMFSSSMGFARNQVTAEQKIKAHLSGWTERVAEIPTEEERFARLVERFSKVEVQITKVIEEDGLPLKDAEAKAAVTQSLTKIKDRAVAYRTAIETKQTNGMSAVDIAKAFADDSEQATAFLGLYLSSTAVIAICATIVLCYAILFLDWSYH